MVHQQVQVAIKSLEQCKRADAVHPLRAAVADKDTQAVRLLASILDRQEYEAKFFDEPNPEFTIKDWMKEASARLAEGDGFAGYVLAAIAEQRCESPDIALDYYRQGSELNNYECAINYTLYRANPRDEKSSWQIPVIQEILDSNFKLEQFDENYFSALIDTQTFVQSSVLDIPTSTAGLKRATWRSRGKDTDYIWNKISELSRIAHDGRSFLSAFTLATFFTEFPEDEQSEVDFHLAFTFNKELNADNQAKMKKFETQSESGDSYATFALVQKLKFRFMYEIDDWEDLTEMYDEEDLTEMYVKKILHLARRGTLQGNVDCAGTAFELMLNTLVNQDESSSIASKKVEHFIGDILVSASEQVTQAEIVDFGTMAGFLREQKAIEFLIWFYGESSRADVAAFWEQRKAALGSIETNMEQQDG